MVHRGILRKKNGEDIRWKKLGQKVAVGCGEAFSKTDAKAHEGNNMLGAIEDVMSPDYPRLLFTTLQPQKGNLIRRKVRGAASDVTTVSPGGISIPYFHHQLVNLPPLQNLIEFRLIKKPDTGEAEWVASSWWTYCTVPSGEWKPSNTMHIMDLADWERWHQDWSLLI